MAGWSFKLRKQEARELRRNHRSLQRKTEGMSRIVQCFKSAPVEERKVGIFKSSLATGSVGLS